MAFEIKTGKVISVNVSEQKGTIKHPVQQIELDENGIVGDAHSGRWHRQISLLAIESINRFNRTIGGKFNVGDFAENITTQGIDFSKSSLLDRLQIGDVELEITQIGKEIGDEDWENYDFVGKYITPRESVFARVLNGGIIKAGNEIEYLPHKFAIKIITLSDRASAGDYEDRSGPKILEFLEHFFADKRWHTDFERVIIPDNENKLRKLLEKFSNDNIDLIFTTGGTGVGPHDITPDIVGSMCDKLIPGIMDCIRIKYGAENPNALISRAIAGIIKNSLVYTLPGSTKAVREYIPEISKTLEHLIYMLHGIDTHL
ncbi:MOSC domain-containing protein [bacterium]|nr:MOSC domain-containing protein [bacterium]